MEFLPQSTEHSVFCTGCAFRMVCIGMLNLVGLPDSGYSNMHFDHQPVQVQLFVSSWQLSSTRGDLLLNSDISRPFGAECLTVQSDSMAMSLPWWFEYLQARGRLLSLILDALPFKRRPVCLLLKAVLH